MDFSSVDLDILLSDRAVQQLLPIVYKHPEWSVEKIVAAHNIKNAAGEQPLTHNQARLILKRLHLSTSALRQLRQHDPRNRQSQSMNPDIVYSDLSRKVTRDGITVEVAIIRFEHQTEWSLEVTNAESMSIIWDEPFATDEDAYAEFERIVAEKGMLMFSSTAET